jgi:hypothetical protein
METTTTISPAQLLEEALEWHEAGLRDKAHEAATLSIAAALVALLERE